MRRRTATDGLLKLATLWLWGGFLYYLIELLWRGHSHPAMFAVGGLCFTTVGAINNHLSWRAPLFAQAVAGTVAITATELASGIILNLWLGLGIWDYSDLPLNFLGQVCVPFSALWFWLSFVAIWIDDYLRWRLFGEAVPRYHLF